MAGRSVKSALPDSKAMTPTIRGSVKAAMPERKMEGGKKSRGKVRKALR
jgi:hypothetical protein